MIQAGCCAGKEQMREQGAIRKRLHSALWIRWAAVYLVIVTVPFLVFTFFFGRYLNAENVRLSDESVRASLEKFASDVDGHVDTMFKISAQVSQNRFFREVSAENYSFTDRDSIRTALFAFCLTNRFFSDIAYYTPSVSQVVFTSQGTYLADSYRTFFSGSDGTWRLISALDEMKNAPYWFAARDVATGRTFQLPALVFLQPVENTHGGFLLFVITENTFRTALPANGSVSVYRGNTQLYPFDKADGALLSAVPGEAPKRSADGRILCAMTSGASGLTYYYAAEESGMSAVAAKGLMSYMLFTALTGLACVIGVIAFSRKTARPIDRLVEESRRIVPEAGSGVESIRSAMTELISRSEELEGLRQESIRSHALIRLIRGRYADSASAEESLRKADIALRMKTRVILLMEKDGPDDDGIILNRVVRTLGKRYDVYGFEYASTYVMLCGLTETGTEDFARELRQLADGNRDSGLRFAVGSTFENLNDAPASYMQALCAARGEGHGSVAVFVPGDRELFYPKEELIALREALQAQDSSREAFLFDVLTRLARENSHIPPYAQGLLSQMIGTYIEEGRVYGDSYEKIFASVAPGDADHMADCVRTLHEEAVRRMKRGDAENSGGMTEVAGFISASTDLKKLTVASVAEQFGMSPSSLSHRFKEQMGCNISDYILARKLNHACAMLRATEDTVSQIAEDIGYTQYTSFVRQFKAQKGMTPSQYRAAWREGAPEEKEEGDHA